MLKINDIYKLKLCQHVYNYLKSPDIHNFSSRFQTHSDRHRHNIRNSVEHTLNPVFLYQSSKEWNSIPDNIKDRNSIHTLKKKMRGYHCTLHWWIFTFISPSYWSCIPYLFHFFYHDEIRLCTCSSTLEF